MNWAYVGLKQAASLGGLWYWEKFRLRSGSQAVARACRRRLLTVCCMSNYMTVADVCDELSIPRSTWDKWRQRRLGPKAVRLPNGQLRIRRADFDSWLGSLGVA